MAGRGPRGAAAAPVRRPSGRTAMQQRKYSPYVSSDLERIPELGAIPEEQLLEMRAVAAVLPFRTNTYVIEELIHWADAPDDPIFQLTFPSRGMLEPADSSACSTLVDADASKPSSSPPPARSSCASTRTRRDRWS